MSHTTVKLTAEESRIYVNEHFLCSGGNWLMSIRHNGEQMPEAQRENVRRLAAAWNACDGIPTETLERTQTITTIDLFRKIDGHDRMLAALQAILPFIPKSSESEGGAAKYSEAVKAADLVRDAIAKATENNSTPNNQNNG